ncbi:hypothetical protein [Streptomyces sp. MH60]|uniref:hypothetical protein n=1 Tax=Streptomyces sp. MH60 TaxID=1940758 RepID=UPI000CED8F45|nr:hypothetical protein [Streptomyces sp. MH60]PPS89449.1 hypothetical protein BZZ08_01595 [Streptomyces sp. MH60]
MGGRFERVERLEHQTLGAQKLAVRSEDYWEYKPEQRVHTTDGLPGVVSHVEDGPFPGSEAYHVVLDRGMGGGQYTASQLRPAPITTEAMEQTAAADYPELAEVLVARPDPAMQQVFAAKKDNPFADDDSDDDSDDDQGDSQDDAHDDSHDEDDDSDEGDSEDSDDDDSDDAPPWVKKASSLFSDLVVTAATNTDFRFHVTAAWRDVVAKAKRIRTEGRLRVTMASDGLVYAEVRGDHEVYETGLQRMPGKMAAHAWSCGCKWGAYHWGASDDFSRFAGRMCSHALALQYEAQSRGMFGRDVHVDEHKPSWVPRKVVVRYDIDADQHRLAPSTAAARPDDSGAPLAVVARAAVAAGENRAEVELALRTVNASWDSWDDDEGEDNTHRTDWDRVHPHLNGVHRGMNIALPDDVHSHVHDPTKPTAERAHALVKEVTGSDKGLGMHWSGNPEQANHYAHVSHPTPTSSGSGRAGTHVILHAKTPDRASIETDDDTLRDRQVIGYDHHEDQEVPISEGEPVHIAGVSWKEPHKHEWTRHDFEKPLQHTANANAPFGEPSGTSYQLPKAPGSTSPMRPWENPASAGPLAGADPVGWNRQLPLQSYATAEHSLFEPGGTEALLHDEPEAALPSTDGVQLPSADDSLSPTYMTAGLRRQALKDFTLAEQQALINEGEGVRAANLDRLDIKGTHYADLEQVLAGQEDDITWLA